MSNSSIVLLLLFVGIGVGMLAYKEEIQTFGREFFKNHTEQACPAEKVCEPCKECPPCKKSSSSNSIVVNGNDVIVDGEVVTGSGSQRASSISVSNGKVVIDGKVVVDDGRAVSSVFIDDEEVVVDGKEVKKESSVRRIYLPETSTQTVIAYNDVDSRERKDLKTLITLRRKVTSFLSKEDRELVRKYVEQCCSYDIYNGIDRPYIEFTGCGPDGTLVSTNCK